MSLELIIINLIANSGEARSLAMEAIHLAKEGKIEEAQISIEASGEKLGLAHKSQTELIQGEARGNLTQPSLLLIHAQDHLMNAITIKDLATEMVELYERMLRNQGEC